MIPEQLKGLYESEEKYRTIFEWSHDAIILADPEGKIVDINRPGITILGYETKDELLSPVTFADVFEKQEDLYQLRKNVLKEGSVSEYETRLVTKQGQVFNALVTSSVIVDVNGEVSGYVVIIRDISHLKKAQEQIETQNIRLAILNSVAMAVSSSLFLNEVLDRTIDRIVDILESDSARIYMLDRETETLHLMAHKGYSDRFIMKSFIQSRKVGDGLLGQTVLTCKTKVVDNFLRSKDPYVNSIIEEGLQSTVYIPLVSKEKPVGVMCVSSHSEFRFSSNYVEFLTAIGNQIGVAIDNANLYESVRMAYHELSEAHEQVIQTEKLASLGKLAATIAHEINNPLAAVLTYIRLMRKMLRRGNFIPKRLEDISRYLATMESETARCGDIVKNLLAFSRQSRIAIEDNDIEEIIDKTLVLISHDLEIKGIQLDKEIESNLPKVRCGFKQIQQALLNLVINGSEAMTKGGVLTIKVRRSQRKDFLEVEVSDTGCGIPEENMKKIFEPFFTTKEEAKGVGLGLSVVYGIITRHNGSIEVESQEGKGSIFRIQLPTAQ